MKESYSQYRIRRLIASRKELMDQPEILEKNLKEKEPTLEEIAIECQKRNIDKIVMIGCGDSYFSGITAKYGLQKVTGLNINAVEAYEFANYYYNNYDENTLVFCISSSGETPAVVKSAEKANEIGAYTVAVTNTLESTIVDQTEKMLSVEATREGWPTQASTAVIGLFLKFGLILGEKTGYNIEDISYKNANNLLNKVPELMQRNLEKYDEKALEIAENYLRKNIYFFIGSGPNLGTAKFGTAKIKEMTQDHALTIITEEFHHYDRSVHENDVAFLIAPQSDGYQRSVETAKFVNKLDADLISIVDEGDTKIKAESKYTFEMDVLPEWLSPLVNIIPLHLFIQHLSIAKVSKGIKSPLK